MKCLALSTNMIGFNVKSLPLCRSYLFLSNSVYALRPLVHWQCHSFLLGTHNNKYQLLLEL